MLVVPAFAQLPLTSRFLALNPLKLFKKPELDFSASITMPVKIDDLLVTAIAHFASDLHLKVGSFPVMRIGGELHPTLSFLRVVHKTNYRNINNGKTDKCNLHSLLYKYSLLLLLSFVSF